MNASFAPEPSGLRHAVALALDALRGIRRDQVLAAVLFGLAMSLVNAISFVAPLSTFARTLSITALLASTLVQDQIHAFALTAAIVVADRAVDAGAPMRRAYLAAALGGCLLGVVLSEPAFWIWRTSMPDDVWPAHFRWLHGTAVYVYHPVFALTHWLVVGGAAVFFYADRRAARRTEARLRAAELDRIRSSKLALESRLQAMQARVEPQFLFNTLAQVERLFEVDAALAAHMLDDLIAYLRAAMPLMRDTSSTVAQEVELARAYLDIARLRLGERLRVSIDVPPDTSGARMPPMMLLPLIDHAIVRGLEPATVDGTIRIVARIGGGRLTLAIVDHGAGLVPDGEADGITAIRQRLDALFRGDATLELRRAGPRATEAILELPLEARSAVDALPLSIG